MEEKLINELRGHLKIAESWAWDYGKMYFIDGFVRAMNVATGKDYGFSGTDIYVTENDKRILVK